MLHKILVSSYRPVLALAALGFIALLSACTPATFPLEITEISITPAPKIGEVAVVHVEFTSPYDESETTLQIELDKGIKLVSGDLIWQGSLVANQVQTHEISICPEFSGTWRIVAYAGSQKGPNDSYGDVDGIFLEVSEDAARVMTAADYEPKSGPYLPNTPFPELTTPICP